MCYRIGAGFSAPKTRFRIATRKGEREMTWGLFGGDTYNSRLENLKSTWKKIEQNRGILSIESFWEGGAEFRRYSGINFQIGVIFNSEGEFSIVTVDANPTVRPYHHRMPLCLSNSDEISFIEGLGTFSQVDPVLCYLSRKLVA